MQPKVAPKDTTAGGVPKPGKGTSAEEWVPRGNAAPKGNPEEGGTTAPGKGDGVVSGMDVDGEEEEEEQEGGGEGEDEDEAEDEEEPEPAPLALVSVMTHRNGCKLLLRLLAPDHTG